MLIFEYHYFIIVIFVLFNHRKLLQKIIEVYYLEIVVFKSKECSNPVSRCIFRSTFLPILKILMHKKLLLFKIVKTFLKNIIKCIIFSWIIIISWRLWNKKWIFNCLRFFQNGLFTVWKKKWSFVTTFRYSVGQYFIIYPSCVIFLSCSIINVFRKEHPHPRQVRFN